MNQVERRYGIFTINGVAVVWTGAEAATEPEAWACARRFLVLPLYRVKDERNERNDME